MIKAIYQGEEALNKVIAQAQWKTSGIIYRAVSLAIKTLLKTWMGPTSDISTHNFN
jgi:hypothetical protein